MKAMCKTLLVTVLISLSGALFAEEGVLEVKVESGSRGYTEGELTAITGGSVTEIQKTGGGTLTSTGIGSFKGKITVSGGTFLVTDKTGLGTADGETWVQSGATLEFSAAAAATIFEQYSKESFHIAGTGVEDSGAIHVSKFAVNFGRLTLEDDASVKTDADSFKLSSYEGSCLDMNGHTLTFNTPAAGNIDIRLAVKEVKSVGTIVVNNARYLTVLSDLPGKGRFVLKGRTGIMCSEAAACSRTIEWDLEFAAGGTGGSYITAYPFNWSGDWCLNSSSTIGVDPAGVFNLYGSLRGSGSLQKGNSPSGRVYLHGENNDFTGTFYHRGGIVVLMKKDGLFGDVSKQISFSNRDDAMFAFAAKTDSTPDGFTGSEIRSQFLALHGIKNGVVGIYVPAGETFVTPFAFDSNDTVNTDARGCDAFKFGSCGEGTCVLTGPFLNRPSLKIYSYGDLRFSNPDDDLARVNELGPCWAVGGRVRFENAGTLDMGGKLFLCSGATGEMMPCADFGVNTKLVNGALSTPRDGNNQNGRTFFRAGSEMQTALRVSTDGNMDAGTMSVCGGLVVSKDTMTDTIGQYGQGCVEVRSGELIVSNAVTFGLYNASIGQLFVSGGQATTEKTCYIGCSGTGIVYQTGGTLTAKAGLQLGSALSGTINQGHALAVVTLAGGQTYSSGHMPMGGVRWTRAELNLVGGILKTRTIWGGNDGVEESYNDVGFNGGTLKADPETSAGWDMLRGNMTATVYAGGAVFDSSGVDIFVGHALVAPAGKGVASIALPKASYSGFAAPPVITISGDGRAASAVPVYDFETGTVTGIRVTCPGYGYTTATATMNRGNSDYYTQSIPLTVTLFDHDSPVRLIKRGAGKLTVRAGQLPADAVVAVEEGSLAGDGVTFAEYAADVATAATGVYGTIASWPTDAVLSIANLDRLDPSVGQYVLLGFSGKAPASVPDLAAGCSIPDGWALRVRKSQLVLCKLKGLMVIVR